MRASRAAYARQISSPPSVEALSEITSSKSPNVCASRLSIERATNFSQLYIGIAMLKRGMALMPRCRASTRCTRERLSHRILAARERLVRPQVSPLPVAATIADAEFVEEAVNGRERCRSFEIENNIGVGDEDRVLEQDLIVRANHAAAAQTLDHRLDARCGRARERPVLARE